MRQHDPAARQPQGSGVRLAAAVGLALVGSQVLLIAITRGLDHQKAETLSAVLPMILGLAVPAGLLLLAGPRLVTIQPSRSALLLLVAVGLAMRLVWLGTLPPLEDDYFRYLWDGAVLAHGLSPYAVAPADLIGSGAAPAAYARLAAGAQTVLSGINFPDMRTIYPSVAQAAFALAHIVAPFKVDGLRLVLLAAELVTLWLLAVMLADLGRSPMVALLYWWNPLPAALLIGLVHVDALIPPFVLGSVLVLARGRRLWALVLVGLGAGVKMWPLLLAPLALWPMLRDRRRLVVAAGVLAAGLLVALGPVVVSALRPGSGLSAYATGWSNNNGFYAWVHYGVASLLGSPAVAAGIVRPLSGLAALAIAVAAAASGAPTLRSLCQRALLVAAALFYLSPAQFPWYAVWFLPLAAVTQCWPLLLASATLPAYYLFYPLWPIGNGTWFFYGTAFVHSVPVLGWLAYDWCRGAAWTGPDQDARSKTP